MSAWEVIKGCRWQLRMGMDGPYGLDFGAIMAVAQARQAVSPVLAEVLPRVETVLLMLMHSDADGEGAAGAPED